MFYNLMNGVREERQTRSPTKTFIFSHNKTGDIMSLLKYFIIKT